MNYVISNGVDLGYDLDRKRRASDTQQKVSIEEPSGVSIRSKCRESNGRVVFSQNAGISSRVRRWTDCEKIGKRHGAE